MKDTMILKDGTTIELEAGASLRNIMVNAEDRAAMVEAWEKLTDENLKEVTIKNGAGVVAGTYADLILVSETSKIEADGTVKTSYHLREKTDQEKEIEALKASQEVQDGAISDLGAVTSALAEQIEGGEA